MVATLEEKQIVRWAKKRRGMARALWALVLLSACLSATTPAAAYSILHHFAGGASDGAIPFAGLVLDGAGNLYGTTRQGGSADREARGSNRDSELEPRFKPRDFAGAYNMNSKPHGPTAE